MVDIKKLKVRKKEYKFELKRRYDYTNHFKIIERPPIEKIKDTLKAMFAPKKEEKKPAKKAVAAPPKGGFNFAVFGAAILVAIIILSLGWIYLTTQVIQAEEVLELALEKPEIYNTILSGHVLSSGERGAPRYTAAVLVDYKTSNLKNYTISLTTYEENIPSEVFILNSHRIEAMMYPDFLRTLRTNLSKRNIMLNEITIKDLETMPQGALVIIPSGVVPKEILGFDSKITIEKLVDRGVVVLYIGQPFTKMLNGTADVPTPQEFVQFKLPISFDEQTPLTPTENFSLFQPLYRAFGEKGGLTSDIAYGSVSLVTKGDGAFIFVPQTLDGGWRGDYQSAARDIARIIYEVPWADPTSEKKFYEFVNQSEYSGTEYLFTEPFEIPNETVRIDFTGYSATSNFPVQETLYVYLEKRNDNELFIKDGVKVVPQNITDELTRITAMLREPEPAQPDMYLQIFDKNGTQVESFPQGRVSVQADRSFDIPVYVGKGEYIISLIDDVSKVYAQSYMKVVSIDIIDKGVKQNDPSVYQFEVSMDGNPVTLPEVTVTVNEGEYGTYQFTNVNFIEVDVGPRTGDQRLPYGKHVFKFTSGALIYEVQIERKRVVTIFENPIFWIVVILTGGIVALGVIFARQESVYYSIDIPDFPPIARTKIPLSPDVVLSMFQKINDNYRWKNTPLTPAEIKNGFKNIFYKGRPIFITDYNVEYLLDDLEKRGKVGSAIGYYGLAEWEKRTKHTIDYLAIMRNLRDICVNNAVPFTGLGESKEADSIITVVGQQMYLHFFDRKRDVKSMFKRILITINQGITIVLFKDNAEKQQFVSLLKSSPSIAPLILKMEADSKSLLFQTTEELENMIVEFKSV